MRKFLKTLFCIIYARKIRSKVFWTLSSNKNEKCECFMNRKAYPSVEEIMYSIGCGYYKNDVFGLTKFQKFIDKHFNIFKI